MSARLILSRFAASPMASWLTWTTILWGGFLLLPLDSFGASPTWGAVRELGVGETALGLVVTAIGLFKGVALALDNFRLRRLAAMANAALWGFLSVMFIRANVASTGTVIYPMLVAAVGVDYVILRLREHREGGQ